MESLRGQLIISSGGLFDLNFRHTVVLIGKHDANGAVGVILNRALDLTVANAVPTLAGLVDPMELLFQGGPVEPGLPVLLARVAHTGLLDLPVFGSVGFLTGEIPSGLSADVLRARVFVGHAGWGPGQLETELRNEWWIVEKATEDDVFTRSPELLWSRVLKRKGPRYAALARVPFDPSMN